MRVEGAYRRMANAPRFPYLEHERCVPAAVLLSPRFAGRMRPVAGRLQRFFGVSQLKIEPQVSGTSGTPQATLTLKQQITREVTFTYIQDVTQGNSQIIRMEWAINPRWSAVAARDLTGEFNVDLFYKKRCGCGADGKMRPFRRRRRRS